MEGRRGMDGMGRTEGARGHSSEPSGVWGGGGRRTRLRRTRLRRPEWWAQQDLPHVPDLCAPWLSPVLPPALRVLPGGLQGGRPDSGGTEGTGDTGNPGWD